MAEASYRLKTQRAPDDETGRPALPLLGATTSTRYFTGFLNHIGGFFRTPTGVRPLFPQNKGQTTFANEQASPGHGCFAAPALARFVFPGIPF
jgi:hypothetical protein